MCAMRPKGLTGRQRVENRNLRAGRNNFSAGSAALREDGPAFVNMTTGSTRRTVRTSIVLKVTVVFASTMAALLIVLLAIGYIYGRRTIRTGVQNRIVGIATSRQALL